jgi:ankyrin repeat protein
MEAARRGWSQVCELLLKAGADYTSVDIRGDTALHWACRRGHRGAATLLLRADPKLLTAQMENVRRQRPRDLAKTGAVLALMEDVDTHLLMAMGK